MHELSLTMSLLELVAEEARGRRVRRVVVEIGKLSGVVPDAVRFAFEVCIAGTVAEGAALSIVETPGRGRCNVCGAETSLETLLGTCPCGSVDLALVSGQELRLRELEVV